MLGREFCRGLIVQCAVRPMLIVVPAPGGDQDTSLRPPATVYPQHFSRPATLLETVS